MFWADDSLLTFNLMQESKLYGAHFKEIDANAPKATKIKFDNSDDEDWYEWLSVKQHLTTFSTLKSVENRWQRINLIDKDQLLVVSIIGRWINIFNLFQCSLLQASYYLYACCVSKDCMQMQPWILFFSVANCVSSHFPSTFTNFL